MGEGQTNRLCFDHTKNMLFRLALNVAILCSFSILSTKILGAQGTSTELPPTRVVNVGPASAAYSANELDGDPLSFENSSCGTERIPCPSLHAALELVKCGRGQKITPPVAIVFRPIDGYDGINPCFFAIGSKSISLQHCFGVTLSLATTSSCSQATLVAEDETASENLSPTSQAVIDVRQAHNLTFRKLHFPLVNRSRLAVNVEESSLIFFEECLFEVTQYIPAVNLLNSVLTVMHRCLFQGPPLRDPIKDIYDDFSSTRPALNIEFSNSEKSITSAETFGSFQELLRTWRAKIRRMGKSARLDDKVPYILIQRSEFNLLGFEYHMSLDLLNLNSEKVSGEAVRVDFGRNTSNESVLIQAKFKNISSPLHSALFVAFYGNEGSLKVTNSSFSDCVGYLGSAVHAQFGGEDPKPRGNAITVTGTNFVGNTARQEGAAAFVNFKGSQPTSQHSNSVVFQRCSFQRNRAGTAGWYQPGVLMVMAGRLRRGLPNEQFPKRNGPSRFPVVVRNCTFNENSGFGSFYGRNTLASLEGDK